MIHKMALCKRCKGQFMADVEVTTYVYHEDTTIKYKTLNCPCVQVVPRRDDNNGQRRIAFEDLPIVQLQVPLTPAEEALQVFGML